nr:peptidoglycan-binding protein [Actinomycetota bacterium]
QQARRLKLLRLGSLIGTMVLASAVTGCQGGAPVLPDTAVPSTPVTNPPSTTALPPTASVPTTSATTALPSTASVPTTSSSVTTIALLQRGDTGPLVLSLQKQLVSLGYWLGTPDGVFGDGTQQAVYALQKAAGIAVDGVVGPRTETALAGDVAPVPRSTSGYMVEVNLSKNLLMFVDNGRLEYTLNTSTGGGFTYTADGERAVANTPVGTFHILWQQDGMIVNSLGGLWRPKFFYSGFAIHGNSFVPPYPDSHGCVRVSNEAIDWIWAQNLAPIGTTVWTYW